MKSRFVAGRPFMSVSRVLLLLAAISLLAFCQQPATVTYTQDFPGSDPAHYAVSISTDGHAHYESNGRLITPSKYSQDDSVPDTEQMDFTPSQPLITKIFDLAKHAHYFKGQVENKKHNVAFTGKKTLTYKDAARDASATYNFSTVAEVTELTQIFQNLSSTLEFGRRLEYCHRHQKLALDEVSKQLESSAKDGQVEDVSAIAPIMQKIVDDRSVLNVVRARLQRLLLTSGGNS
jgi:hypothetical protein